MPENGLISTTKALNSAVFTVLTTDQLRTRSLLYRTISVVKRLTFIEFDTWYGAFPRAICCDAMESHRLQNIKPA